ncbi:MAG: ABC transporter ATP-binding protein, partial [Coleofasciculus sp. S288]|nr:ABC transporter ATP-binding protein [Coleofasciculus sp. S288]
MTDTVLDVRNLKVEFQADEKRVVAVDGINFQLERGQTLGIVGESGSGKSVTSLAVIGLVPSPGKVTHGDVYFRSSQDEMEPVNLLRLSDDEKRLYRGGKIAMIFQEPMSSLNPVYTCGFQLTEAILQHQNVSHSEARRQAIARLQEVKLLPSDDELRQVYLEEFRKQNPSKPLPGDKEINHHINQQKLAILERYPHELSGGQLQRVTIAMAISCNPDVLIADEPTTALDVTVQAQVLDLLRELRDNRGMSMIFITHDLGVIAEIADTVAVMYQGKIVESGDVWQIFSNPKHPYTKGLLACRPRLEENQQYLPTISDFMEVVTTPSGELRIQEKVRDRELETEQEDTGTQGHGDAGTRGRRDTGTQGHGDTGTSPTNLSASSRHPLSASTPSPLVTVRDLRVGFPMRGMFGGAKDYFMAVKDVSFDVYSGETLGLVGESGCGKTTLARTLIRLIEPMSGEIRFEGQDVIRLSGNRLRQLRREMQIVFQNPFSSLDPRMKIGEAIMEPLSIHAQG